MSYQINQTKLSTTKFRAKSEDHPDSWVFGTLVYDQKNQPYIVGRIITCDTDCAIMEFCTKAIVRTLGRFTGYHDQQGFEIYEGDYVRSVSEQRPVDIEGVVLDNLMGNFIIRERNAGKHTYHDLADLVFDFHWLGEQVNVINNIYDRPELWR